LSGATRWGTPSVAVPGEILERILAIVRLVRWRIAIRAGVAVALVLGFYLLVLAYGLGLPFGMSWLAYKISSGNVLVLIMAGLGVGLVVGSLVGSAVALRSEPVVPRGIPLYREDAPELWRMIGEIAARVGTRAPDQVWLTGEVGASVVERSTFLGLLPGSRTLFVGLPVMLGLSRGELRAVFAHEHGHFAHQHSRLRAVSYRTHVAVGRVVERFAKRKLNPLSWLFRGYATVFLLVQRAVSRQQEQEADLIMGRLAGRACAQSALRGLEILDAAWRVYIWEYVHSGLHAGFAPSEMFDGFARLLEARRDRLDGTPVTAPSRWDTHPTLTDRLWALESAPDVPDLPAIADHDGKPAADLIPNLPAVAGRLQAAWFEFGAARRLPWEDYEREAWLAELDQLAGATYRAIGRATGETTLDAALQLCAEGEGEAWLGRLNLPEGGFTATILKAAHTAGTVRFEQRWDVPSRVLGPDGHQIDLGPVLDDLGSGTSEGARRVRAALARLGIDVETPYDGPARQPAGDAAIIGALGKVSLDGELHYLLITDLGLLFIPQTDKSDNGKEIVLRLAAEPPGALAARPGTSWLPYEEITGATIHRSVPINATIRLYTGAEHTIVGHYTGYAHEKSLDTIQSVLRRL
jgi:Zn-dependent protease with chaperone function